MTHSLNTPRLILRPWQATDLPAFIAMGQDEQVMRYFPNLLSQEQSEAFASEIMRRFNEQGWGFWAVALKESADEFLGFVGLNRPGVDLPFNPCVEIGWRLMPKVWGQGLATEAARACLDFAFTELNLSEVVSFTATTNTASMRVMAKLGLTNCHENFFHPALPKDHALAEHVLYKICKTEWLQRD